MEPVKFMTRLDTSGGREGAQARNHSVLEKVGIMHFRKPRSIAKGDAIALQIGDYHLWDGLVRGIVITLNTALGVYCS